jgi:hypothetical protein
MPLHATVIVYWVAGFHWVGVNSRVCVDIHLHLPSAVGEIVSGQSACWSKIFSGTMGLENETRTVWYKLSIVHIGKKEITLASFCNDVCIVLSVIGNSIADCFIDFINNHQITIHKKATVDKIIISFFLWCILIGCIKIK